MASPEAVAMGTSPPQVPAATSPMAAATANGFEEDTMLDLTGGSVKASAAMLNMQALFGPIFQVEETEEAAAAVKDPGLLDTRSILLALFGGAVREDDVQLFAEERHGVDALTREMKANREMLVYEEGARYFGAAAADVLRTDPCVPFTLLESSLPPGWEDHHETAASPSWLLDMPAIFPNRQTLHADPRPCDPSNCAYLESNKFMLYTPSNVLRWSVGDAGASSNTRMVRWSDGSLTLHVGGDLLTLLPSQEPTLHLLGEPLKVGKAGMSMDAVVTSVVPEKHLTARIGEAVSIEVALARERRQRDLQNRERNLPYADNSIPSIDWARPRKGRTIQEEFVREEYDMREREMRRRVKEGRPMTLAEQLQLETQLQDHVTGASVAKLQAERDDLLRQAALKAAQRAENLGSKRSRLDRDLNLQGGYNGPHSTADDPFLGANDDDKDEASTRSDSKDDSDADSYEQQLADMYDRNNSTVRKKSRLEDVASPSYAGLIAALRTLLTQIPMHSESFASVDGTLSFLCLENTPKEMVRSEVPKMLAEVAAELPSVSTQRVKEELDALFFDDQ